jgi:hypothetical protein
VVSKDGFFAAPYLNLWIPLPVYDEVGMPPEGEKVILDNKELRMELVLAEVKNLLRLLYPIIAGLIFVFRPIVVYGVWELSLFLLYLFSMAFTCCCCGTFSKWIDTKNVLRTILSILLMVECFEYTVSSVLILAFLLVKKQFRTVGFLAACLGIRLLPFAICQEFFLWYVPLFNLLIIGVPGSGPNEKAKTL